MAAMGGNFPQIWGGLRYSRPGASTLQTARDAAPGSRHGPDPKGVHLQPDSAGGRQLLHQGGDAAVVTSLFLGARNPSAGHTKVLQQQTHSRLEIACRPPAQSAYL